MIIARAPVRISFGGGGTDLAAYYERFGGFVVSAAISHHCHVIAREPSDGKIRISSADYGVFETLEPRRAPAAVGTLALPRATLAHFWGRGLSRRGVELALAADVPPGTGLGSSSAMAVAICHALAAYTGAPQGTAELAESACAVEIERLRMPIGRQDQYASAFGGLNALHFSTHGVTVEPLAITAAATAALSERLLLFSTGLRRHSAGILRRQQADSLANQVTIATLHRLKELAQAMRAALESDDLDGFGQLLDTAWQAKRRLSSGITTNTIDSWYAAAREAGALGGKITGAGGGGYLLLYCPPAHHPELRAVMADHSLRELPFDFDNQGAHVREQPEARVIGA